jgi:spermidine synthase
VKSSRKDPALAGGMIVEQNNATGRVSYWQSGDHHSEADRNGVSLAEYIHAMYGLIRQAKSRSVLMIGCGGGTLATMLQRAGVTVVIVDIDAMSFEIAHRYFHMPEDIECHVADGLAFLKRDPRRFDAVVLDAYSNKQIPKQFLKASFFALVKARLTKRGGIFLSNLIVADDDDPRPDQIMRTMRATWRNVRILDSPGWLNRNAVLAAGTVNALKRPNLLMKPERGGSALATSLKTLKFRSLRD